MTPAAERLEMTRVDVRDVDSLSAVSSVFPAEGKASRWR